jgi:hypothetical protein
MSADWQDDFEDVDDIGLSWGQFGDGAKWAFQNVVHPLGKGIATAAGAGSAAQSLEDVEKKQGWLPSTPPVSSAPAATAAATLLKSGVAPKGTPGKSAGAPSTMTASPGTALPLHTTSWFQQHPIAVTTGALGILGFLALVIRAILKKGATS